MTGLPPGWEWDYDGQRWFYKYKPTGLIQYHFPSEGDEFPAFIEAGAPAPDLAPEERLESQQQIKRQTSSAGSSAGARSKRAQMAAASNGGVNKYAMSATAKPISAIWEGDDDAEAEGVFQPENFMFLGPGAYADVSPLVEEEEEAAKRSVVGAIGERVEGGRTAGTTAAASAKGVSPLGSTKTTPMMAKSEPSASPGSVDASVKEGLAIESAPVTQSAHEVESEPIPPRPPVEVESTAVVAEAPDSSVIHMIDSREMPVEMMGDTMHRFDPVGFVAEMPTEHTAAAYVELYPDPVEIADNTVLAPIETATAAAELPVKNSPVEGKEIPIVNTPKEPEGGQSIGGESITREDGNKPTEQRVPATHIPSYGQESPRCEQSTAPLAQNARPPYADHDTGQGLEPHGSHLEQHGHVQPSTPIKLKTFKIARKQPGSTPGTPIAQQSQQPAYQAYVPGQATTTAHLSKAEHRHSIGLLREASLMMNMKRNSISINPDSVPQVLAPPQHPVPNGSSQPRSTEIAKPTTDENITDNTDLSLAHAPSVLKPARNRNSVQGAPSRQQQVPTPCAVTTPPAQRQLEPQRSEGISKFPSVLRPARGRSSSQPGQIPVGQLNEPQAAHQLNQHAVVSQDPLQPGSRLYQVKNNQPTGSTQQPVAQQPLWATANARQPARPASAMPSMNHVPYGSQYSGAGLGLIPDGHQPTQPSLAGCQPPELKSQPSPLQRMQQVVASQPPRPQTVVGTIPPVSANTDKATIVVQPQQPASPSYVQPLQQIQDVITEQLDRPRNVPAVIQPPLNVPPLQDESIDSRFQVQPVQQVRNVEAGQPQPQPQLQNRPSAFGQHVAGERPSLPQNTQTAANVGTAVNTPSVPNQQESEKKLPLSIFQVQPLQQIKNAEAGQPSQLQSVPASVGVAQHAGGHSASVQQESHTASQFQVQPLQDIQNASAGQPIKPHGVQEASQTSQAIAGQSISARQQQPLQQSSTYLFQVAAPNRTQDAAAGQPPRPHSAIGTIQHTPPPKPPKTAFAPNPSQPGSGAPTHPGMRRASMFTPDEVPPTRPREDSQVSALGSPLPTNSARRGSSNPTINDSNYTPSPLTDTTGPLAQNGWTQQNRSPPLPAKIREHAEGSFFPVQNTTDLPPSQGRPPTKDMPKQQQQQQDTTSQLQTQSQPAQHTEQQQPPQLTQPAEQQGQEKQLPQEPTQDSEHPIGYQVNPFTSQSSHSPAGQQTVTTPGSGHILGRIEEHDENEQSPKIGQARQITRPSSMASSIQHSIPDTSASHEPTLHQPKPSAPTQIQRPVQTIGQSPMPPTPLGQPPIGQSAPTQQPQVMPPGHMYAAMQTQIVPGKAVSNLNPWHPQGQWNPPVNHNRLTQGSQEKEKKWSKWFKSGNTKPKPVPQQMMQPQPGPIPGPGPQQWTGGPYSPSHFWQQPGPQRPFSHGQSPSMSDSASISTVGSDKGSQQHNQHVSSGQVPAAIHADPTCQLGPGQAMHGQATHRQTLSGQMLQGQNPSQMPPQKRPMPLPLGQIPVHQIPPGQLPPFQMHPDQQLPGQMPAGRGYAGQAHPLQMAANTPLQGFTASQPQFQHQGRMEKTFQGPSNPNQPHMGHSKSPSTISRADAPQQGVPPQQVHTPGGYRSQHPTEHNMMPPPLFAPSHGDRLENGKIQPHLMSQPAATNKWARGPAADYSGGDWGDEEDWGRR